MTFDLAAASALAAATDQLGWPVQIEELPAADGVGFFAAPDRESAPKGVYLAWLASPIAYVTYGSPSAALLALTSWAILTGNDQAD